MLTANSRLLIVVSLVSGLIGGIFATFLLVGSSVIAQPTPPETPQVISAQEFRLVDTKGRIRAILDLSDQGEPYFQLKDKSDTDRVWIGISSETGIAVRDVDGRTRLVLSVDEEGKPSLVVRDREHHTKEFHP
ncbi:MAG TPA: hypothetical protein VEI50_16420 [Nitrospiraceae bacterium]|nr:hypothetical protein [Nitrospiraceae bacterium]